MRRVLGRGLSQLVAEQQDIPTNELPVGDIEPNTRQPRSSFNEENLQELSESIKEFGVLQPLIVRPIDGAKYELIAGERRLRAAKLAGLDTVPVIIRPAGGQTSLELALVENIQREDINALESARAYRRLIDEFGMTQEAVAKRVGKSRTAVANSVRLLRLPRPIADALETGIITEGHARALLAFESEAHQLAVFDRILEKGLTVREVEKVAKPRASVPTSSRKQPKPVEDADLALQDSLSNFLGTTVKINRSGPGGKVTIDFYSDDDLDRIFESIGFRM